MFSYYKLFLNQIRLVFNVDVSNLTIAVSYIVVIAAIFVLALVVNYLTRGINQDVFMILNIL